MSLVKQRLFSLFNCEESKLLIFIKTSAFMSRASILWKRDHDELASIARRAVDCYEELVRRRR